MKKDKFQFDKEETKRYYLWRCEAGRLIANCRPPQVPKDFYSKEDFIQMYRDGLTPIDVSNKFYSDIQKQNFNY